MAKKTRDKTDPEPEESPVYMTAEQGQHIVDRVTKIGLAVQRLDHETEDMYRRLETVEKISIPNESDGMPKLKEIFQTELDPTTAMETLVSLYESAEGSEAKARFTISDEGALVLRVGVDNLILFREAFVSVTPKESSEEIAEIPIEE